MRPCMVQDLQGLVQNAYDACCDGHVHGHPIHEQNRWVCSSRISEDGPPGACTYNGVGCSSVGADPEALA